MKFIKMAPTWNVKIMSIKILKIMPQQHFFSTPHRQQNDQPLNADTNSTRHGVRITPVTMI